MFLTFFLTDPLFICFVQQSICRRDDLGKGCAGSKLFVQGERGRTVFAVVHTGEGCEDFRCITAVFRDMLCQSRRRADRDVSRMTACPVVLMENGYLSNPYDADNTTKPEINLLKAQAMAKGIAQYFLELNQ